MTTTTFSPDLLVTLPRPGGVQPSPSGNYAVYAESQYNAQENEVKRYNTQDTSLLILTLLRS